MGKGMGVCVGKLSEAGQTMMAVIVGSVQRQCGSGRNEVQSSPVLS